MIRESVKKTKRLRGAFAFGLKRKDLINMTDERFLEELRKR